MKLYDAFAITVCVVCVLFTIGVPALGVYYLGGLDAWCALAGVVIFWAAATRDLWWPGGD